MGRDPTNIALALIGLLLVIVRNAYKREARLQMIRRTIVHRTGDRRKLGRGQFPAIAPVTAAVTSTGTTNVTLTFSQPVVVNDSIPLTVSTLTLTGQTIVSPTVVTFVASGNVATKAWTLAASNAVVSYQGGTLAGASGTFP